MKEPKLRSGTKEAIEKVAQELKLPYEDYMQDWSYMVANPNDIEKYIEHYELITKEDEKFVLMEIIIQAINDQTEARDFEKYWDRVQGNLRENFELHEYTIFYWSRFDSTDSDEEFIISSKMRDVWKKNLNEK